MTGVQTCALPISHHLLEGVLYDSHHQALQTDRLLHVEADGGVADPVAVLRRARALLHVCLVGAAVLGQADRGISGGVLQQVGGASTSRQDLRRWAGPKEGIRLHS